ncbi:SGNH hydrolase domain-containing protein [Hahella ganghwensis]|uniref:SGNH hydrolase domain-containing protein n=1 Tax=Hahella ganghwensis TaxID=286420 RepID=UPI003CCBD679
MVIVGSSGYLAYWSDGYPWRSNQVEYQTFEPQFAHWDYKKNETCTKDYTKDQLSFLIFCVANSDSPELILFGDSHANHLYPGLLHAYGDGTGVLSVGNGTPLDGVHVRFDKPTDHPWINGDKSYDLVLHRILTSKTIKTVIYAAHWEGPIHGRFVLEEHRLRVGDVHLSRNGMAEDNKAIFKLGFEKTLETLLDSGKNVVVVIDTPEVMVNPRKCLRDLKSETLCSFSKKSVMDRQEYSRAFIAEMKAKYPQIKVFDPVPIVCPTDDVA